MQREKTKQKQRKYVTPVADKRKGRISNKNDSRQKPRDRGNKTLAVKKNVSKKNKTLASKKSVSKQTKTIPGRADKIKTTTPVFLT